MFAKGTGQYIDVRRVMLFHQSLTVDVCLFTGILIQPDHKFTQMFLETIRNL